MNKNENLKILGLPANATDEEIKKRFRKISKENHQDVLFVLLKNKQITKEEYDRRIEEFKKYSSAYQKLINNSKQTIDIDNNNVFNSFGNLFKEQIIKEYLGQKLVTPNNFINILFEEAENNIKIITNSQESTLNFKANEIINVLKILVNETNKLLKTDIPYRETIKEIKIDVNTYFIISTNLDKLLIDELFKYKNIINNKEIMKEALNNLKNFKDLIEKENSYQQKLKYLKLYFKTLSKLNINAVFSEIDNIFNENKKKL